MLIGHTGRGTFLVVTGVNALRALPTLGVLLLGVLLWGLGLVPPTVALMLLGIPPLLAGTYAGSPTSTRTSSTRPESMGMTESRVLLRVETPNALPLILGGLRTATLQIVATATVAAYASLGGLGRYLIDGIKVRAVPHRAGRRADGDGAGADPRRRAGVRGVGVGAGFGTIRGCGAGCRNRCSVTRWPSNRRTRRRDPECSSWRGRLRREGIRRLR